MSGRIFIHDKRGAVDIKFGQLRTSGNTVAYHHAVGRYEDKTVASAENYTPVGKRRYGIGRIHVALECRRKEIGHETVG